MKNSMDTNIMDAIKDVCKKYELELVFPDWHGGITLQNEEQSISTLTVYEMLDELRDCNMV